jgi:hypothetical protein
MANYTAKDWVDMIGTSLTALGIVVGALWAGSQFLWKREPYPKVDVTQSVYSTKVSATQRLVHVALTIENRGSTILRPKLATVDVMQVKPWPTARYGQPSYANVESGVASWPHVAGKTEEVTDVEIEPNEKQQLDFDFFVDESARVLFVKSFVENPSKKVIGWALTTTYEVEQEK